MNEIITMSNQTEGRDKFTKAFQYASRMISWALLGSNAALSQKFKALFSKNLTQILFLKIFSNKFFKSIKQKLVISRDSRKIFRLFKSLNEYHLLKKKFDEFIWSPKKLPIVFDILQRLGFLFYWIFDNIQILASIKFITADPAYNLKLASFGWFVGCVFGIARHIFDILEQLNKKPEEKNNKVIMKNIIDIIGKLGDLLISANGLGIPEKILGKGFNDGVLGLCGLIASLVSLYNLYPKK